MAIIKIRKKEASFVMLDKACVQDVRLSWKARGLLVYLLSLPADWEINVRDLIKRAPDGRDAVYSIIKELRRIGYIKHERHRSADGTLDHAEYQVFEIPQPDPDFPVLVDESAFEPHTACPDLVTPDLVNPDRDKPDLYIINNIQNKQETKETAASNNHLEKNEVVDPAAAFFSKHDALITNKLTAYQKIRIEGLANSLIKHVAPATLPEFSKQIAETVLNPGNFTLAGRDFHKKLNTIQKMILAGKWTPPIASIEQEQQIQENKLDQHRKALTNAISKMNHWIKMRDYAIRSGRQQDIEQMEKWIQDHKTEVQTLQQQLKQLEEEYAMP